MLLSTDGLPGPVTMNRLGKPAPTARGRSGSPGPRSRRDAPSDAVMSMLVSAPVIASKPIAKTMMSSVVVGRRGADAVGRDPGDRRLTRVDQFDVVAVGSLVVAGVDTRALGPDGLIVGTNSSAVAGSVTTPGTSRRERGGGGVRCRLGELVGERV